MDNITKETNAASKYTTTPQITIKLQWVSEAGEVHTLNL